MDIVPIITKDNLSKEQIEYLQKQQTEYKLINRIKKNPGHILFSFNRKTGEIKRAYIIHKVAIGFNGLPVTKAETVIDCIDLSNNRSKIAIFFHWRDFNKIKQTARLVFIFLFIYLRPYDIISVTWAMFINRKEASFCTRKKGTVRTIYR